MPSGSASVNNLSVDHFYFPVIWQIDFLAAGKINT